MGYYTRFEGNVTGPAELLDDFEKAADAGETFGSYGGIELNDWLTGEMLGGDSVKWYDWKKDMAEVSAKYPALLFTLKGEGEEAGDIWKAWARNGKVVVAEAKIVFEEPDLDAVLPSPDVAAAIAARRAERAAEIQAEIARLESEKKALLNA